MRKCLIAVLTAVFCGVLSPAAFAQQTTGTITGRILDQSSGAMPGVSVTVVNPATGYTRTVVTSDEGVYRIAALPVGTYDLTAELAGFQNYSHKGLIVSVGQVIDVDVKLVVASLTESVTVTGESPLIETSSSSVGGVVDIARIENMPLNGRQFANLAATIPGVGLGFHSDPTKSTQYAPQVGGGNGRNINYQIDGGDNNDDTVGGLLQLFPLEAIQEFNMVTSRYRAEYGRSNGGVMNIVTKSGTNVFRGSAFSMIRDDAMAVRTETQKITNTPKQDYRRWQFGGSFGGPIMKDKAHFFVAAERTAQDTFQVVNTQGLFPSEDGTFATPYRETLVTGKVNYTMTAKSYLAVRYGRNQNSQPYAVGTRTVPSNWGDSINKFNSINVNHNLVVGNTGVNEFVFQYADFKNNIYARSKDPRQTFPNNVAIGQNGNTPQTTQQKKWQFRDDFSWYVAGKGGIGHSLKTGVSFINEPTLYITFNSAKDVLVYTHLDNTLSGPLSTVSMNSGEASASVPMKQFAAYVQDDWKVSSKLTLNIGVRYDVMTGYQIDQSKNPNFVKMQAAGKAGLLNGIRGLENFGLDPKEDYNNIQPRIGFAYDIRGDGKDVLRGGWGLYTDVGYTNSNVLFPAIDATGIGFGAVLTVDNQQGIRNPDGSFYRVGQPVSNIASQNAANPNALPLYGQFLDPRLQMPYTRQVAFGWSHELMTSTVMTVDTVWNQGRDLNTRARINTRIIPNGVRRLAFLSLQPNAIGTRAASAQGESDYKALIFGFKRRMHKGLDLTATYTLQKATSTVGNAADEMNQNNIQDAVLFYDDPKVNGPTARTDSRHSGTVAAVFQTKWGITVSPWFIFRSPLPVSITEGLDRNLNGENNDLPDKAFVFDGVGKAAKETGACETWNCGRGAWRTQFNLRASKSFNLKGSVRIEAIGEIFNVLNAKNPSGFITGRLLGTGAVNPNFMQPTTYSGDFQTGEQRLGQVGLRFSF